MRLIPWLFLLPLLAWAEPAGQIVTMQGGARLFTKGVVAPVTAKAGDSLAVGQTLKTRLESQADLRLTDGTKVIVGPNSAIEFIEAKKVAATGPKVLFKVTKQTDIKGLTITTPSAIIGVRGTTFLIATDTSGKEVIYLKEGMLAVHSPKGEFKSYLGSIQEELDTYKKEFDEYKKQIEQEHVQYVQEVTMQGGIAISIDGGEVRATPITETIQKEFEALEKF